MCGFAKGFGHVSRACLWVAALVEMPNQGASMFLMADCPSNLVSWSLVHVQFVFFYQFRLPIIISHNIERMNKVTAHKESRPEL
jgi:myo-inositol catabolism protein IolC